MGKIRDKMQADLELRGLSPNTQRSYLSHARQFVAYFKRPPTELGAEHVREFLLYLAQVRKSAPATRALYIAALRFLFVVTLGRPDVVADTTCPKIPRTVPVVLSLDEIARFFTHLRSMRYRALLMVAYGAGLRVSEACGLRVEDIDSSRMVIHVRGTHQWGPIRVRLRRVKISRDLKSAS